MNIFFFYTNDFVIMIAIFTHSGIIIEQSSKTVSKRNYKCDSTKCR